MSSHRILDRSTINGKNFAVVEFFDRVRLRYVQRRMIDGKPATRERFETEIAAALRATPILAALGPDVEGEG